MAPEPGTSTSTLSISPPSSRGLGGGAWGRPEINTTPPGLRYPIAVGRRRPGGPTALETTASKASERPDSSTSRSARPSLTVTSMRLSSRHAARRKETRFLRASISVSVTCGSARRIGRPGIPLPAPISRSFRGPAGRRPRKRRESRKRSRTIAGGESRAVIRCVRFHRRKMARYRSNCCRSSGVATRPVTAVSATINSSSESAAIP